MTQLLLSASAEPLPPITLSPETEEALIEGIIGGLVDASSGVITGMAELAEVIDNVGTTVMLFGLLTIICLNVVAALVKYHQLRKHTAGYTSLRGVLNKKYAVLSCYLWFYPNGNSQITVIEAEDEVGDRVLLRTQAEFQQAVSTIFATHMVIVHALTAFALCLAAIWVML